MIYLRIFVVRRYSRLKEFISIAEKDRVCSVNKQFALFDVIIYSRNPITAEVLIHPRFFKVRADFKQTAYKLILVTVYIRRCLFNGIFDFIIGIFCFISSAVKVRENPAEESAVRPGRIFEGLHWSHKIINIITAEEKSIEHLIIGSYQIAAEPGSRFFALYHSEIASVIAEPFRPESYFRPEIIAFEHFAEFQAGFRNNHFYFENIGSEGDPVQLRYIGYIVILKPFLQFSIESTAFEIPVAQKHHTFIASAGLFEYRFIQQSFTVKKVAFGQRLFIDSDDFTVFIRLNDHTYISAL